MKAPGASRVALTTLARGPGWGPSLAVAAVAFAVFRAATEVVGLVVTARRGPAAPPGGSGPLGMWRQWDVNWLIDISRQGYRALSHVVAADGSVKDGTAFPPAMPLLLRGTSALGLSAEAGTLLLSGLFLLLALAVLYRLTTINVGSDVARWTLVFLLVYPFSLFFATGYAESLVLLGTVSAFYAARRTLGLVAGIAVSVALMAKVVAVVALLALTVEWLGWEPGAPVGRRRGSVVGLVALWLPPLVAVGAWMAYLGATFGDPLRFVKAQRLWGRAVGFPLHDLGLVVGGSTNAGVRFIDGLDLLALVLVGVMTVYAFRRLRPSSGVLLAVYFLVFAFNTSLQSNGRHLSPLFPIFVGLAHVTQRRPWLRWPLLVGQLSLAVLLTARFVTGHWAG